MSIRQLSFEEGEALDIRACTRLPQKTSIEELKKLAEDETAKIVKSGKSYFDVTNKPEIYDQAHEFDINELTGIDRREMQQADATPAFSDAQIADPMSMLYQNTSQPEEEEYEEFERKTYYLRPDQAETLEMLVFDERKNISTMLRELLDIAIAIKSEEHNKNYKLEAEQRILAKPRKPKRRLKKK